MIDSKYRNIYQAICVDPLLKQAWVTRLSPTTLTGLALLFGICIPICLFFNAPILALIFLILTGFFDTLDGSVARYTEKSSPKGAALDITADRVVEFAVIFGIFVVDPISRGLLCLLMVGSTLFCITTFLVVGIFSTNSTEKSFFYSPGLVERAEAFLFFALIIAFPILFVPLAITFASLVTMTGIIRITQFVRYYV